MARLLSAFLLSLLIILGFGIRQEMINTDLRRQNELLQTEINDLAKKQRLTAADVGFIERIVLEGIN